MYRLSKGQLEGQATDVLTWKIFNMNRLGNLQIYPNQIDFQTSLDDMIVDLF